MRASNKVLLVLFVLVLCVVGFGFYSGWWSLSSSRPDPNSNNVNVNLSVNPDKMKADTETVKEQAAELTGQSKKKANELGDRTKEE